MWTTLLNLHNFKPTRLYRAKPFLDIRLGSIEHWAFIRSLGVVTNCHLRLGLCKRRKGLCNPVLPHTIALIAEINDLELNQDQEF